MNKQNLTGLLIALALVGGLPASASQSRSIRARYANVPFTNCQTGLGLCTELAAGESTFDIQTHDDILQTPVGGQYRVYFNASDNPPRFITLKLGNFCGGITGVTIPPKPGAGTLELEIYMMPTFLGVHPCGRLADDGTTGIVTATVYTSPLD